MSRIGEQVADRSGRARLLVHVRGGKQVCFGPIVIHPDLDQAGLLAQRQLRGEQLAEPLLVPAS
ncbi:MAG TPA: hypothetical protein VMU39_08410 [Solirubrobacteraceae bacterium]|nr:hypothetical protein [Solirubrobacteraceae bacterium]